MTHLADTSAVLAHYFREPGATHVQALFDDPNVSVGVSVLTVFELATAVGSQTGDLALGEKVSQDYASVMDEVVPVTQDIVSQAIRLRRTATSRIALADCLIAATAVHHRTKLVHRDPHFAALPTGKPEQETLPDKN